MFIVKYFLCHLTHTTRIQASIFRLSGFKSTDNTTSLATFWTWSNKKKNQPSCPAVLYNEMLDDVNTELYKEFTKQFISQTAVGAERQSNTAYCKYSNIGRFFLWPLRPPDLPSPVLYFCPI
jgi:hypothetical protein